MDPIMKRIYERIPGMKRIIEQAEMAMRPSWSEEAMTDRMAKDAAKIRDPDSWPYVHLMVKTQPWVTEAADGKMRFGMIPGSDLCLVKLGDGRCETFASVEELVKVWSVD